VNGTELIKDTLANLYLNPSIDNYNATGPVESKDNTIGL
jgi:hypothetical protein